MNQIVRAAWMPWVSREDALRERDGIVASDLALVRRQLADIPREHQRERRERCRVDVVRISCGHTAHRVGEAPNPHRLLAVREERLDRGAIRLLASRLRSGDPRVPRRGQPVQRPPRGVYIVLAPEQVTVGNRFCPVGHGEAGIRRLCGPKRLGGFVVLEAVKQCEPAQEGGLSRVSARIGKRHRSKSGRVGLQRRCV